MHLLIKSGKGKEVFSAPGLRYIREKQIELMLNRGLDLDVYSRAIAWGNLMEKIVWMHHFPDWDLISNDYRAHWSDEFFDHWSGIPDLETLGKIAEIKCYQLKNFAQYSYVLMQQDIQLLRNEFPQEYWQLVSNAIINRVDTVMAISYMPTKDELESIIDAVENTGLLEKFEFDPWQYRWLTEEPLDNLPYLPEGSRFNNVTTFEFVVPPEDKLLLTERVRTAIKFLDSKLY